MPAWVQHVLMLCVDVGLSSGVMIGTFTFTLFLSASIRHYRPGRITESTTGYTFTPFEIFYFRVIDNCTWHEGTNGF